MARKYGDKNKIGKAEESTLPTVEIEVFDRKIMVAPPHTGAFIYLNNILGLNDPLRVASSLIEFLCALLDDMDARYIGRLVLDKNSGFDIWDVEEILTDLVEEWGENPTKPASGSSPSQVTTGKRSTANSRRVGSTRTTSPSTAS